MWKQLCENKKKKMVKTFSSFFAAVSSVKRIALICCLVYNLLESSLRVSQRWTYRQRSKPPLAMYGKGVMDAEMECANEWRLVIVIRIFVLVLVCLY